MRDEFRLFKKLCGVIALCIWSLSIASISYGQGTLTEDYDTFMKRDLQARIRRFNEISPENRAELVRTQITRWIDLRRASLTAEQLKLIEEWLSIVSPDTYRLPKSEALMTRIKDLETRSAALFTREDLRQALTINGDYIPKK